MQKTESTEKDQSIATSIGKWFLGLLKYLFRYDPDERWIVGIILLLAFVGTIIYLWPIFPTKFGSDEFKQGLGDKFAIFFITTVALTVFLKRFFDKVDRRKFHSNLKMLCISHKMHEVLIFCLEYFDKLSSILDERSNKKLNFDFRRDILPELPALCKYIESGKRGSVDAFWHDLEWGKETEGKRARAKEFLMNQDLFYGTGKRSGRYGECNLPKLADLGESRWKDFRNLLQTVLVKSGALDALRLNDLSDEDVCRTTEAMNLSKKWYMGRHDSLEDAKHDRETIVGSIEYLRDEIYKMVYKYSDRKSADGMDPFLKLTTVLDRIDWKINTKNKDKAEKGLKHTKKYAELFIGLEDDFVFLFSVALSIYGMEEMFLPSYASYEQLVLEESPK